MKRMLTWLLLLVLIVILSNSVIYGRSWFDNINLALEDEIGNLNYQAILEEKGTATLTAAQKIRLERLFRRLTKAADRRKELTYRLTVLPDPEVNAFALPGGYLFVNQGTLGFVKNDGELAGVLGHELAHVELRHGMKAVTRVLGLSLILNLFFDQHSELVARLAGMAMNLAELGYSRAAEFDADRKGYVLMCKAGYRKEDLLGFWRRLQATEGKDSTLPGLKFFSTHPPVGERIKRIEAIP